MAKKWTLVTLCRSLDHELEHDILPFWGQTADYRDGGFAGRVGNDGSLDFAHPRGLAMHAELLWTYARAWGQRANPLDMNLARHAKDFLLGRLRDWTAGGFWELVDAAGEPVGAEKGVFGQATAIYGLSQLFLAGADREALDIALETFALVEAAARDRQAGGYFDALGRPGGKSAATNLRVLAAYESLYRASGDAAAGAALAELVELFRRKAMQPDKRLGLRFDRDWRRLDASVSPGLDCEASWLLCEAAAALGERKLGEGVAADCLAMVERHRDAIRGGGLAEPADGESGGGRSWRTQAEALVALVNAWEQSCDPSFLAGAGRVWDFVRGAMLDRQRGEWFAAVDVEGRPREDRPKGGVGKTGFHNARACMEIHRRAQTHRMGKGFGTEPTAY